MAGKSFLGLAVIVLLGLSVAGLNSCAPSVNDAGTPNALVATPDTVTLAGLAASGTVSLRLNCGCTFIFDSVVTTGDTAAILVTVTPTEGYKDSVTTHHVTFSGKPGTISGPHNATYTFYTYDADTHGDFWTTVHVFLTVP